jgi:hypothetical protein
MWQPRLELPTHGYGRKKKKTGGGWGKIERDFTHERRKFQYVRYFREYLVKKCFSISIASYSLVFHKISIWIISWPLPLSEIKQEEIGK